jgi:CheY-like chemotaxis protein/glycine cleavage system H lipoate-binding protein
MTIGLFLVFALVCLAADLAARQILARYRAQRRRREREEALRVSLQLDFTREAKSLKRVEVAEPRARVLCIDDEDIILDSFRRILVLDGYAVDTVQTGPEALGLLRAHHYDFVFTDLRMPGMDGLEVVKAVKHVRPDIDVVIITGYATIETAVECMKFGALDYVQKPFTEEELRAFVKKALLRRQDRLERQLRPAIHITHGTTPAELPPGEFSIPGGVLVSPGHCWVSLSPEGTVKIGLDDFAKKLIGRVDAVELPPVGATVRAGEPLFTVRQKGRRIPFVAPVSGRVTKINQGLAAAPAKLDASPYEPQWLSMLEADNLNLELPALRIGRAAEALFQEDIGSFRAFMRRARRAQHPGEEGEPPLVLGALETLTDQQWDAAAQQFFARRN